MKVEITADGVLTVEPENSTEAYALRRWKNTNFTKVDFDFSGEKRYCRGSGLRIKLGDDDDAD